MSQSSVSLCSKPSAGCDACALCAGCSVSCCCAVDAAVECSPVVPQCRFPDFRNCKIIYEKYLLSLASRRKITKTRSMPRLLWLISALLMSYLPSLVACEGCKEPSNVIGASGVGGIGASFSWSVLFMIGMLAFLMTGMVLMMIRSCRQLAAQRQRVAVETH